MKHRTPIIVWLSGGLGNQLFQFIFGVALSKIHQRTVFFDVSDIYKGSASRDFAIQKLGLNGNFFICKKLKMTDDTVLLFLPKPVYNSKPPPFSFCKLPLIQEKGIKFDKTNLSHDCGYFHGYWQSHLYWQKTPELIGDIDCLLEIESEKRGLEKIYQKNGYDFTQTAIHIRRGDYLVPPYDFYHGTCSIEYYKEAIKTIKSANVYIFTDDVDYAKKNFDEENYIIVSQHLQDPINEFLTLKKFSNLIISNSSYSYLAAIFSSKSEPNTHCISPYPWYSFTLDGPDPLPQWNCHNRSSGKSHDFDLHLINNISVSVIIPAHTRAEFLVDAVNTALSQSFAPIEIILALNEPNSLVRATARNCQLISNKVKIVESPIAGLSHARNLGIMNAQGTHVAFLDDDDLWDKDKIKKQVWDAIFFDAQMVISDYDQFNQSGMLPKKSILQKYQKRNIIPDLIHTNILSGGSSCLFLKEVFNQVGLFDEALPSCEDHDMWTRVALAGHRIYIQPESLTFYRINNANMTGNKRLMLAGELKHLGKILENKNIPIEPASNFFRRISPMIIDQLNIGLLSSYLQSEPTLIETLIKGMSNNYNGKRLGNLSFFSIKNLSTILEIIRRDIKLRTNISIRATGTIGTTDITKESLKTALLNLLLGLGLIACFLVQIVYLLFMLAIHPLVAYIKRNKN